MKNHTRIVDKTVNEYIDNVFSSSILKNDMWNWKDNHETNRLLFIKITKS